MKINKKLLVIGGLVGLAVVIQVFGIGNWWVEISMNLQNPNGTCTAKIPFVVGLTGSLSGEGTLTCTYPFQNSEISFSGPVNMTGQYLLGIFILDSPTPLTEAENFALNVPARTPLGQFGTTGNLWARQVEFYLEYARTQNYKIVSLGGDTSLFRIVTLQRGTP